MNSEIIYCVICENEKEISEIMTLHDEHLACLVCLKDYVYQNLSIRIKCPVPDCKIKLKDSDIRRVLNEDDIFNFESLSIDALDSIYTCLLPECGCKIEYEKEDIQYECSNCTLFNCIACKASHAHLTCKDFRDLDKVKALEICQSELKRARKIILNKIHNENRESFIEMNKIDLLPNNEIFECFLCCTCIAKGQGVKLRNCYHFVCRTCLENYLRTIDKIPPKCPHAYCSLTIEDREIKEILSKNDYEIYNQKLINRVKAKLVNYYQCQTPDCTYICELKDTKMKSLKCPKCKQVNCLLCHAVHKNENCAKYKKRIELTDIGANRRDIQEKIKKGECMMCPDCNSLIQKVRGCNWIQCPSCGVELCWILQMHRWGPGGRGDISGGCRCLVNDIPCHKDCNGCIPHNENEECCIM